MNLTTLMVFTDLTILTASIVCRATTTTDNATYRYSSQCQAVDVYMLEFTAREVNHVNDRKQALDPPISLNAMAIGNKISMWMR